MSVLGVDDVERIVESVKYRQNHFVGEEWATSLRVVLVNFGDHKTKVACVGGEWVGSKGDLPPTGALPRCPNGHVLTEGPERWRLGLVPDTMIADFLAEMKPEQSVHTQASTDAGPDYCEECSQRAQAWIMWPCPAIGEMLDKMREEQGP